MNNKINLTKELKEFTNEKGDVIKYNQVYLNYDGSIKIAIKAYSAKEKEILKMLASSTLPYEIGSKANSFNDERNGVINYTEYYICCGGVNARFRCLYKSDKEKLKMIYNLLKNGD